MLVNVSFEICDTGHRKLLLCLSPRTLVIVNIQRATVLRGYTLIRHALSVINYFRCPIFATTQVKSCTFENKAIRSTCTLVCNLVMWRTRPSCVHNNKSMSGNDLSITYPYVSYLIFYRQSYIYHQFQALTLTCVTFNWPELRSHRIICPCDHINRMIFYITPTKLALME